MSRRVFEHGLVVGKFYPPHLGHVYLVRTALLHCRRVSVLVLASSAESLPLLARSAWLRECFPREPRLRVVAEQDDVPIDYHSDSIWQAHVAIMQQALSQADARGGESWGAVDAVFSSEHYGAELAARFGAKHVCLDPGRALFPISGTQVRADVAAHWQLLPGPVRAGLALRVVVLGAESSGTTTLARQLTEALRARSGVWGRTQYVAEYGREYSANLLAVLRARRPEGVASDLDWQETDFLHIAGEQNQREQSAAAEGSPVLVCDTDAFATCIWHERYRGEASQPLMALAAAMPPRALYLLTPHDEVPFEQDGLRDGEHLRAWMTERFTASLSLQPVPWLLVRGDARQRASTALARIDALIRERLTFAPPLEAKGT